MIPVHGHPARKWLWWTLAGLVAFQVYFVRELLAAWLLFAVGFGLLAGLTLIVYLVKAAGETSLAWVEPRTRGVAEMARRSLVHLEDLSRKKFRGQHSEPAG